MQCCPRKVLEGSRNVQKHFRTVPEHLQQRLPVGKVPEDSRNVLKRLLPHFFQKDPKRTKKVLEHARNVLKHLEEMLEHSRKVLEHSQKVSE